MFIHPEITSQLGREHQRQMLATAHQRRLRRQARKERSMSTATPARETRTRPPVTADWQMPGGSPLGEVGLAPIHELSRPA